MGRLVLDRPELAAQDQESCDERPVAQLERPGMPPVAVDTLEVDYGEPAMAVLEVAGKQSSRWYRGRAGGITFWVRAQASKGAREPQYLSFEHNLVFGIERIPEACDSTGRCRPISKEVQDLAAKAGQENEGTCYGNAYGFAEEVPDVVKLPGGRNAYRVVLDPALVPKYGKHLPLQLLVPTYDSSGAWTGFFYARGC